MNRDSLKVDIAAVIVAGCAVLWTASSLIDTGRIYVSAFSATMNDQVAHIALARRLADTGQLDGSIVYPAVLGGSATKTYVYMPGYYWLAALFYKLLGYSNSVALLPSAAAHVASAVMLLLTGRQLGGVATGRTAAFLFVAFPAAVAYALSAMTDSTFAAFVLLAFCGFVHLPPRLRPWIGPLLLVPAFLVRETAALLSVPMLLMMLAAPGEPVRVRVRQAATLLVLAIALLAVIYLSDASAGRPPLQRVAMFSDNWASFTTDAVAYAAVRSDWTQLPAIFLRRLPETIGFLRNGEGLTAAAMRVMLLGFPMGIALFAWRREPLGLATAGYVAVTAALHSFHYFHGPTGVRMLLTTLPFTALVMARLAVLIGERFARARRERLVLVAATALATGIVAFEVAEIHAAFWWYSDVAEKDAADVRFVTSIAHDDRRLLAGPWDVMLSYVQDHYPVKFALVPDNAPSLRLLMGRYDVGTVVIPPNHPLARVLGASGFVLEGSREHLGRAFQIWKAQ